MHIYQAKISGVGYQPWLLDDPDSTLIRFNPQDKSSYQKYVDALDKYLSKYRNLTATRECVGNESNAQLLMDENSEAKNLAKDNIIEVSSHLLVPDILYTEALNNLSKFYSIKNISLEFSHEISYYILVTMTYSKFRFYFKHFSHAVLN